MVVDGEIATEEEPVPRRPRENKLVGSDASGKRSRWPKATAAVRGLVAWVMIIPLLARTVSLRDGFLLPYKVLQARQEKGTTLNMRR